MSADGSNLNVAIANIRKRNRSAHRPYVYMTILDVVNIHHRIRAFQRQVSMQALRRQGTRRRVKVEGSVRRNQHFVVNPAGLLVRALQQMRRDFNPVAILLLVDFHVVRLESSRHQDLVSAARLYRNRSVLRIHGNNRVGADRKTVFLLAFGEGRRQTGCQNQRYDRGVRNTCALKTRPRMTRHKTPPLRPGTPVRPSPIEYDPTQSGKEVLSVDTHPSDAAGHPGPADSD